MGKRGGEAGIHSSSSSSFPRCVWFGCFSERQQRPRSSSCLSPPAFIFPSSVSQSGWREAGGAALSPPQAYRDLLGLKQAAALPFPLDLHGSLIQDIFLKPATSSLDSSFLCGFLHFAAALLGLVWSRPCSDGLYLGLAGQPTVLINVRQVSLREEAARSKMSLMLCRWEQKNFTMKLVG